MDEYPPMEQINSVTRCEAANVNGKNFYSDVSFQKTPYKHIIVEIAKAEQSQGSLRVSR